MSKFLVQISTPYGPWWIDPNHIVSIGWAEVDEMATKQSEPVRYVFMTNGGCYVFDTADNMTKMMR